MFEFNEKARTQVQGQIDGLSARIRNQVKIRDELQSRMDDPDALYFCGYFMKPDFVKVGDHVDTKYGDAGQVVRIDRETEKVTIQEEDGREVEIGSDRISSLVYGGLEWEPEPAMDDEYGWG